MPRVELQLKQASAVLGIRQKDLQNVVQAGVLKPRRRLGLYYFDTSLLLQATVVLYLKDSLGASTRYLTKFADAVARLPGFESSTPAIVRLKASAGKNEPPVEIRIPLGALAKKLRRRLPIADLARDLPPGRPHQLSAETQTVIEPGASDRFSLNCRASVALDRRVLGAPRLAVPEPVFPSVDRAVIATNKAVPHDV